MQENRPRPGRRPDRPAPERDAQPSERLVYGKNPVAELLKSGAGVDTVLLAEGDGPGGGFLLYGPGQGGGGHGQAGAPQQAAPAVRHDSHQGVAAFASEIAYAEVDDLLSAARARGEAPFLVISDGIEDPHNLGAVIRSALLCGAHGVIIPKRGGASVTPTVIKASAGAAERLPVARVVNIGETIRRLKEQGVFVYCADMDGVSLRKKQPHRPHRPGAGQRGQRGVAAGQKAVRRGAAAGYGRPRHRRGQLQRFGGGRDHPLRDPGPARRERVT